MGLEQYKDLLIENNLYVNDEITKEMYDFYLHAAACKFKYSVDDLVDKIRESLNVEKNLEVIKGIIESFYKFFGAKVE